MSNFSKLALNAREAAEAFIDSAAREGDPERAAEGGLVRRNRLADRCTGEQDRRGARDTQAAP